MIDYDRYARQIALPEIGESGQMRLAQARVLIVGVGGLGSPVALYLAAAGVGQIGLVDDDVVSLSNLQRQVLYTHDQIGERKAPAAAKRLHDLNPTISVCVYDVRLTCENAEHIIADYDIVVDGCDNRATRLAIDKVCRRLHRIYIYAAIEALRGQVAVFDYNTDIDYAALFGESGERRADAAAAPPVVGTTPALVGSVAAAQAVQIVCGYGTPLINRLLDIDLLTMNFHAINLI